MENSKIMMSPRRNITKASHKSHMYFQIIPDNNQHLRYNIYSANAFTFVTSLASPNEWLAEQVL